MSKRKDFEEDQSHRNDLNESSSAESSSEDDTNMLDVDFEWFDPQPEHDFHGLKTLLRQLFDVDGQLFELGALADVILAQPLLGSTVKVDGNETDPYAFLTILNLHEHREKPVIKKIIDYLIKQSTASASLSPVMNTLSSTKAARVGLVLTERLLNVPSEVVPPMYKMLLEEISWAVEDQEPYEFSHYLILSKTYQEVESNLDEEPKAPQKKKKRKMSMGKETSPVTFYFHPEDEVLHRHSIVFGSFDYVNQEAEGQSDAKRTFQELGIRPQGHMILIEAGEFGSAVNAIEEYFSQT